MPGGTQLAVPGDNLRVDLEEDIQVVLELGDTPDTLQDRVGVVGGTP